VISNARCQSCNWTGPADLCGPLKNAHERVQPGDVMPAGECPVCNASAMLVEDAAGLSVTIVTLPDPERATHFGVRSTAQSLANVMALAENRYCYPVQDLNNHGFRVAVFDHSPYRQILPHGYLRLGPS